MAVEKTVICVTEGSPSVISAARQREICDVFLDIFDLMEVTEGSVLDDLFCRDDSLWFTLQQNGKILGVAMFHEDPQDPRINFLNFGVLKEYRGKGLGRHFLRHVSSRAGTLLFSATPGSEGFYERCGAVRQCPKTRSQDLELYRYDAACVS